MFFSANNLLNQYSNIIKNSFFLSIVYGIKLLLPFISMPYIIRVCGVENYGKIILAQTIILYFNALVNLGLPTILPKEIANNIHSIQELSRIASAFIAIRVFLAVIGAVILSIITLFAPILQNITMVIIYAYIAVIAEALSTHSIFQGLEKMQNIAIINSFSVIFYIASLLICVRNKPDYVWIPLLQSLGLLIASCIGLTVLRFKYNIRICVFSFSHITDLIYKGTTFALSHIFAIVNSNFNRLFAGMTLGMYDLALLDISQKISETAALPTSIIEQAIFPHNARKKDISMARQMFWIMLAFSCICALLMLIGTPLAVKFLGAGKLNAAIPLTCWLGIKVVLSGMNYYSGAPLLVAFGFPRPYNSSIIISTILVILLSIIFYFMKILSLNIFVFLIILGDLITFIIRIYYCKKYIDVP